MENRNNERFANVSKNAGPGMNIKLSSRGAGFDDLDNDGDLDAVILNSRRRPTILRNDTANSNHWLRLRLQGTRSNRDGIGAHVTLTTGTKMRIAEVHSGRGYQSHFGLCLHFGLGTSEQAERIEIQWIGGTKDVYSHIKADQTILLVEGQSSVQSGESKGI